RIGLKGCLESGDGSVDDAAIETKEEASNSRDAADQNNKGGVPRIGGRSVGHRDPSRIWLVYLAFLSWADANCLGTAKKHKSEEGVVARKSIQPPELSMFSEWNKAVPSAHGRAMVAVPPWGWPPEKRTVGRNEGAVSPRARAGSSAKECRSQLLCSGVCPDWEGK